MKGTLKVLLVHNFYQSSSPSGEDAVFRNEAGLLRSKGVEVVTYERHNDDLRDGFSGLAGGLRTVWSRETYRNLKDLLKRERPDIAHFHNIWYLISPSAYYACKDSGVPVVQTLHNFRMFCANGLLLRNGRVCEECIGKPPWRSVAYGCYRNSRLYSLPVVFAEMVHRIRGTWVDAVDSYIALTDFGRRKFVECGLPEKKIFVKPNFLPEPPPPAAVFQNSAIFIGRLSEEKGVRILMDAAKILSSSHPCPVSSFGLKVVGDGPLGTRLQQEVAGTVPAGQIEFTGRKSRAECLELLAQSGFLVLPSICFENFPMAVVEAFACGKPVIASNLGAMADIVKDHETGLLFETGKAEDLASKMRWMVENRDACLEMGRNARAEFDSRYTADRNFETLSAIYENVLKARR